MNSKDYKEFIRWEMAARDHIDLKRCYVDVADGDLPAGVLLSQIIYWFLPSRETGAHKTTVEFDGQRWLVKSRHEWWDECRLTPKTFDRAIELLRDAGLVQTCIAKWSNKPTLHLALQWDNFIKRLKYVVDHPLDKPSSRKGSYHPRKGVVGSSPLVNNQSDKGEFTKGEEGRSPKVKKGVDQRSITLTKSTTKTTPKITNLPKRQKRSSPKPRLILKDPPETDHMRLMRELFELTGPFPDGGAQGKAAKWLLEKHGLEKSIKCLRALVGQLRDRHHWRDSRVSLLTVQKEIGSWEITGQRPDLALVGKQTDEPGRFQQDHEVETNPRILELSSRDRTPEETQELAELLGFQSTTTQQRRAKECLINI